MVLLLFGYGFESILKFAFIKSKSYKVKESILANKKIPIELKTHDLVKLSKLISFKINLEEKLFLQKLTVHIIWAGRYPIPLSSKQFDEAVNSLIWSQTDIDKYFTLRDKIFASSNLDYDKLKNLGIGLSF